MKNKVTKDAFDPTFTPDNPGEEEYANGPQGGGGGETPQTGSNARTNQFTPYYQEHPGKALELESEVLHSVEHILKIIRAQQEAGTVVKFKESVNARVKEIIPEAFTEEDSLEFRAMVAYIFFRAATLELCVETANGMPPEIKALLGFLRAATAGGRT